MKKTYKLEELECANCASKMETAINAIDGVNSASISFMAQKLTLDVDETRLDEILDQAERACKKYESDVEIVR